MAPYIQVETKAQRLSKRSTRTFLGLFILVGAVAIGCGAWTLLRSLRCAHWPTTEGVIETAEMVRESSSDGDDTFSAKVSYSYQVAGIHHESTRLAFGEMTGPATHAQRILTRYTIGRKVPVHYSPEHPELAVLETGIHGGTWICFGVGTVLILFGWMFLKLSTAANRPQTTPNGPQFETEMQQPPVLMGVLFMLMGSFAFFMEPPAGIPPWVLYATGGFMVLLGLFILALHLGLVQKQILNFKAVVSH
jgi:hypothetical protein